MSGKLKGHMWSLLVGFPESPPLFWIWSNPVPPPITYHHDGPVAVTVEGKLCTTGPLMTDFPHHGGPVLLIECVSCVNDKKLQVLLLWMMFPEQLHNMYPPLYTHLKDDTELFYSAGLLWPMVPPLPSPRHILQSITSKSLQYRLVWLPYAYLDLSVGPQSARDTPPMMGVHSQSNQWDMQQSAGVQNWPLHSIEASYGYWPCPPPPVHPPPHR